MARTRIPIHEAPDHPDDWPVEPSPEEYRRMKSLYEGEKAAGLHKPREEYEADLIDAGRGHLLGRS